MTKQLSPLRQRWTTWLSIARDAATIKVSVRDEGIGLPPNFDMAKSKGIGMRLIRAFTQQLEAVMSINASARGTEFVVVIPVATD